MTGQTKRPLWQLIVIIVGVLAGLFVLLIIGGWAMVIGLGVLCGYGYWKTSNQGLLTACGLWIGLGIGMGVEILLKRTGGVPILGGIGVGLLGAYFLEQVRTGCGQRWLVITWIGCTLVTAALWSASQEVISIYLIVLPIGILGLLLLAGWQFWQGRKHLATPAD